VAWSRGCTLVHRLSQYTHSQNHQDEELIIQEQKEAIERERREAEEAARREQEEKQRQEREKQEQQKREEKERIEREKSERAIRGGIRGVRGTRASTRGVRSAAPPRTGIPHRRFNFVILINASDTTSGPSRGVPKRPPSASARPSGSGIPRSSYRPT